MPEPWFLGAWWPDHPDEGDFEDTAPKPRGEIYRTFQELQKTWPKAGEWQPHERMATVEELDRAAVQAPAGTGAAIVIDETPGD